MKHIYEYVKSREKGFLSPIEVIDGWSFNFQEHIRRSILYKNSQFFDKNDKRELRPFKNIVRPMLNIQYRTENIDVKDIEIYVDDPEFYHQSFLLKKFHEQWALEQGMDTFIDELVESYVDLGGVLVKKVRGARPEIVNLQTIAFCDPTDLMSGVFAIKHYFNPEQLREMVKQGWDSANIETLISKGAEAKKEQDGQVIETPSKYIEVYELHGIFPESYLNYEEKKENEEYFRQIHIISYYKTQDGKDEGLSLFSKKEPKLPFKFLKRDPIFGRALGFGGVEEIFEPQVWTNFSEQKVVEMLEHASKVVYWTNDPAFKNRQKTIDLEMGQILTIKDGGSFGQIDNAPRSLAAFTNEIIRMEEHANQVASGGEVLSGESPSAGTPFKLQELIVSEAKGLHNWRKGRLAVFLDEIYRDWILPNLAKEVIKGKKFLSELSADELQEIAEKVSAREANRRAVETILNGNLLMPGEAEAMRQTALEEFTSAGNKKFIEILKDEFTNKPLKVRTNIAGKQKNLAQLTDKLVNMIRQFIATPELRQDPEMVRLVNFVLEGSGMSPVRFGPRPGLAQGRGGTTEPLKQLGKRIKEEIPVNA